jgi:ABC-type Fe3+ transport system permease subunit
MSKLDAIVAVTITVLVFATAFALIAYSGRIASSLRQWAEAERGWSRPKGQSMFATNLGITLRLVWMAALLGCGIYTVIKVHDMAETMEMIHNQNMLIYDTQVAVTRDYYSATHR